MKILLILPAFFYVVFLTFLGIKMFRQRKAAVTDGRLDGKFFKTYDGAFEVPNDVQLMSRHFNNQFQFPLLYLITLLFALQLHAITLPMVVLSWTFLFSRFFHSYVHLGSNHVLKRAKSFFFGVIVLVVMWIFLAGHAIAEAL